MKKSAAKTLGVAALGAAFAAAGAGAANAAPAAPAIPDPSAALGPVSSLLPVGDAVKALPAGANESLAAGQGALGGGLGGAKGPAAGLLGGLPVGGTGVNGLPLG
ncbi:ATP-binding protein [Streptomyces sp. NPDC047123]|uniref:ATP-binding protein n=1 Tax=unclassified Streptomyces TaxID=2593676 RepID=UPI0033D9883F